MSAHEFEIAALVLGGALALLALGSGIARRSVLSPTALAVVLGFVLGNGATGVLHFDARSTFTADLATVALIVILFRDGLERWTASCFRPTGTCPCASSSWRCR
jgi:NhaP-type Na+/H+ or K+/H+ antiporter